MNTLQIKQPDDWHAHFRDGEAIKRTINDHAQRFARAIVMPNLSPPITNTEQARAYRDRLLANLINNKSFSPLMTLYLTAKTTANIIREAKASQIVHACKLYPAGVTTGSEHGIHHIQSLYPIFEIMAEVGLVLCIHGEVNDPDVDVFDREAVFIDTILAPLIKTFPTLKIVLEHISTNQAVEFVRAQTVNVGATITPQHIALNRQDLLGHGIRPHYFCLPILKRREHQQAVLAAAISGDAHFFLGSDSAPHAKSAKINACGCAGIYSGCNALEVYAQIFEACGALDKLEAFASIHGANFYGLPINQQQITLIKEDWQVPQEYAFAHDTVVPLFAGETLHWKIQNTQQAVE